jgi:hypothetical protein
MRDTASLHPGSFEYDILLERKPIDLTSLTGPHLRGPGDVITNQWLLFKNGDNGELADLPRTMTENLLAGPAWFSALYRPITSYALPNGDTAYLYRRSEGPADPYLFSTIVGADLPPVAAAVRAWWSPTATVAFATPETAVWLGTQDIPFADPIIPTGGAHLQPEDLGGVQRTLIVLSRYHTAEFQEELGRTFRYITEVQGGEFTATLYGGLDHPLEPLPVAAAWDPLRVTTLASWPAVAPGDPLPLDLTLDGQLDGAWGVSARLVSPENAVLWQQDTAALPGRLPLTLFVPPNTPPGEYSLQLLVYNAATQEAAVDVTGRTSVPLATIEVLE